MSAPAAHTKLSPAATRITLLSMAANLALAITKTAAGIIAHSHALIADGLHSIGDLASDLLVLFALRQQERGPDSNHPYGHERISTLVIVIMGLLIIATACGLLYDAIQNLTQDKQAIPIVGWLALTATALSLLVKEMLYRYTYRVGKREGSSLLLSNAWHHRSDALSSLIVLIGLGGSLLGLPILDLVATIIIAIFIFAIGWSFVRDAILELVDTGLPPSEIARITDLIKRCDGVVDLHQLRSRRLGGRTAIDIHIQVAPRISVSEGHRINLAVRDTLFAQIQDLQDIVVHVDAEDDDESIIQNQRQALRSSWQQKLQPLLQKNHATQLQELRLHYLGNAVEIELLYPDHRHPLAQEEELVAAITKLPGVARVQLLYAGPVA